MERQSFRFVVIGGPGSGKTSYLAAMFGLMRTTDGSRHYWLDPADLESLERMRSLGLHANHGYPGPTGVLLSNAALSCKMVVGATDQGAFRFSNLLRPGASSVRQGALLDIVLSDYPGEWLDASGSQHADLWEVLIAADALVVAVDGESVLALMQGEPRGRTYAEEGLPRILDLVGPIRDTREIPVDVVLTKWDLLDAAGYGLGRVRDRLLSEVEGLRHLVEVAPVGHTRLIPVSTAGYFQHTTAKKVQLQPYERPLLTPRTVNLDIPLSLALPSFADEALAEVRRHRRRRILAGASLVALALIWAVGHAVSSLVLLANEIGKQVNANQADIAQDAGTVSRGAWRLADRSRQTARRERRRLIHHAAQMHEVVKDSCTAAVKVFDKEFGSSDLNAGVYSYQSRTVSTRDVRGRSEAVRNGRTHISPIPVRAIDQLDKAADRLALWVRSAAEAEIRTRGLDFPTPIGFRWRRNDGNAARPAEEVRCHASRLIDAYEDLQATTLIVTASPGAGKTVLSLLLVRGLAQRRLEDGVGSVPVSVAVTSWDGQKDLQSWILEQVSLSHPWLRVLHTDLLHSGRLLVVLDGVDEMPAEWIGGFLQQSAELSSDIPLVITCRTGAYASLPAALNARGNSSDAVVIELLPASVDEVVRYAQDSSPAEVRGEWLPLKSVLLSDQNKALREVLTTPLMAWLVARLYAARPAHFIRSLGDSPDASRIQGDLLQMFLAEGLRQDAMDPATSRLLRSLARLIRDMHPVDDHATSLAQDFAWWRLADVPSARRFAAAAAGLFGGVVTAVAVGIGTALALWGHVSAGSALAACAVLGALAGCYVGYRCARNSPGPTSLQFKTPRRLGASVRAAVVITIVGCATGYAVSETARGVVAGLLMAVPVALVYAFLTTEVDSRFVASPRALYVSDFTQSVTFLAAYALSIGSVGWWFRGPALGVLLGITAGITGGMTYGIVFELAFVDKKAGQSAPTGLVAWLRFRFAAAWLAARGHLPWRIFGFLGRMHQAGLLRQVGPVYQFRHVRLLEELAEERNHLPDEGA